jgi:uncharacterized repeat protein (TIGR01451 family)
VKSRGFAWSANERTRRGLTLSWLLLFVFSILLQYGTLASPRTALANATGNQTLGGFELDGNLFSGNASPGSPNGDDWAKGATGNGLLTAPTIIDPIGNADTSNFSIGSKEGDDPSTWAGGTGTASPKDDNGNIYIGSQLQPLPPGANSHLWSFLGLERAANNGTTFYDFEFNQNPNVINAQGISVPNRAIGDVLIVAQQQGAGPHATFDISATIQKWTASGWSAPVAPAAGSFYGLSNDAPIPQGPWTDQIAVNGLIPQLQFAEMAFDFSANGLVLSCPSNGFGEVNVRTRSSISDTAALKDYASAAVRIPPTCANLAWQKQDGNGSPLGGATFTVTPNPFTGAGTGLDIADYVSASPQADPTKDQDGRAGYFQLIDVLPGTYTVTEKSAPPGYIKDTTSQQITLTIFQDGSLALPFVNPRKTATTTLVASNNNLANGSFVAAGQSITLTATESNTGQSILHNIAVSGTGSCATWTAAANKNNGAGAYSGTLQPGESVNYSCTFTVPAVADFTWSATATGLDEAGDPASAANETINGNFDVLQPATKLTISQDAPLQVHAGDQVTIVVNEKNDGEGTITNVHVDGTGPCASNWVAPGGFNGSLAPGASVDFTCAFLAPAADFSWTADGKGTDALGHAVPATNEHAAGSVDVVLPSTLLTLVSAPDKVHAGDTITIVVNEKNTGDGPLSNVHVVAGGACAAFTPANVATLAAGASQDFTCTITTTAGDGTDKSWTADGKGTDALGAAAPTDGEHQAGTVIVIAPATTLVFVSGPTKVEHGSQVTLTVKETNTGDDTLTAVNVTGTSSCANWTAAGSKNNNAGLFIGSLAPGESVNFSCTFTVGTADVSWTALGHGTDSLGAAAPAANEDEAGNIDVINPATVLTFVSAIPNPVVAHGSTTITVNEKNTGDSGLTNVNVTGSPCATWTAVDAGFDGTLAAGASEDFTCTVADVGTTNVNWSALGHGTDELDNAAPLTNEDASGNVHVVNPNIDIVKTAGASLNDQAADGVTYQTQDDTTVVYKYVVTTQDPDGLTNVTVTDDKCSPVTAVESNGHNVGDTNANDTLEPGESWVFSCSTNLTIANDGKTVHNIATASGQPLVGDRVSSQDDANVTLLVPGISIVKTAGDAADGQTYVTEAFADNVTYHYSIKNTGELDLSNVTVVDDNGTPGNTADDILVCTIPSLAVGATATCDKTLTVTQDTTNVAVATGHTAQKPDEDVSADDNAVVDVVGAAIQIIKTAGDAADGAELVVEPGTDVTYHYAVTNTGEVDLVDVHVVDDAGTPGDTSDDINVCTIGSLAVGQTAVCSVIIKVDHTTTNVAVASGHTEQQPDKAVKDDDNAVVRTPALTIAKSYTGNTGGTAVNGTGIAKVGDTLTYTLAYNLSDGPVTNGVITDVLPDGLAYVSGSATNNDEYTFQGYNAGTRTLTWTAPNVTKDGSVSYKVTVLTDAFLLDQPLQNTATIDSDQTSPSSDTADVLVQVVEAATATPKITLPPTDTIDTGDQAPSNPGFGLMLTLLVLAAVGLAAGFLTPTPGRPRRERVRRP